MLLSMALWKAVADRHDLLVATWDSGRVGQAELERLSTLVWGRLDASRQLPAQAPRRSARGRRPRGLVARGLPALRRARRLAAGTPRRRRLRGRHRPPGCASCGRRSSGCATSSTASRPRRTTRPRSSLAKLDAARHRRDRPGAAWRQRRRPDRPAGDRRRPGRARPDRRRRQPSRRRPRRGPRPGLRERARGPRRGAARSWRPGASPRSRPAPRFAVPDVAALGAVPREPDAVDAYLRPARRRRPRDDDGPGRLRDRPVRARGAARPARGVRRQGRRPRRAAAAPRTSTTCSAARRDVLDAAPADLARARRPARGLPGLPRRRGGHGPRVRTRRGGTTR